MEPWLLQRLQQPVSCLLSGLLQLISKLLPVKTEQDSQGCFIFRGAPQQAAATIKTLPQSASTASATKKSRSRCPGKKRQTASEREKLRMRDLSKAMHHLRSFLPPSVVPEGQALTKIETLRLTMGYISHLSAQLGLSEECLEHKRASGHMKQDPTIIPLQETPCSPQPGACPGAYTSPLMISAGLCYTSQCWVPQQQHPHMGSMDSVETLNKKQ
uniref:Mesoderm posterior aa n=1 Tax=Neogobius melanostomus TaxID=47308 RepID=A0A8C6TJX3_9GOBI